MQFDEVEPGQKFTIRSKQQKKAVYIRIAGSVGNVPHNALNTESWIAVVVPDNSEVDLVDEVEERCRYIVDGLSKQPFADWFNTGAFDDFIQAVDVNWREQEPQILRDVKRFFRKAVEA